MENQLVFILCDNRSGSTLLEQLLGAHSEIVSVGELHWLRAYALNDRRLYDPPYELLCSCGQSFAECEFWQAVSKLASRPLGELQLLPNFFAWRDSGAERPPLYKRVPRRLIQLYPGWYRSKLVQDLFGASRVARDSMTVFEAIIAHSNPAGIVESSKSALRFRSIYDRYPDRAKAIVLHRDYRAIVYSKMKRGASLEAAANTWALKIKQIDKLTSDIPDDRIFQIRYEDLCADPRKQMQRACQFLNIKFEEAMLARPTEGIHDLGGSPSKFQVERKEIRFDSEYLNALSQAQLSKLRNLVGDAAESCGYG